MKLLIGFLDSWDMLTEMKWESWKISELEIDKWLYAVLPKVDDQLEDKYKNQKFEKPWRLNKSFLYPMVVVLTYGMKLQSDYQKQ